MLVGVRLLSKKGRFISNTVPWQKVIDCGLYDVKKPDYYRTEIDLDKVSNILSTPNLFWDAFQYDLSQQKGVSKLETIVENAEAFVSKGVLVDREEAISALEAIISKKSRGSLVLYLGGKSTGKTRTLVHIKQTSSMEVVYVNGREFGTMTELLAKDLPKDTKQRVGQFLSSNPVISKFIGRSADIVAKIATGGTSPPVEELAQSTLDAIFQAASPIALLEAYLRVCGERNTVPTLVIDELSRFMKDAEKGTDLQKAEFYNLLELFVSITKENNQCKIILASSEHAFPFRLNAVAGINFSQNVTDRIFAGEVPPKDMFEMLTKKWGMGPSLASVFIACYGGHIWNCALAVDKLLSQKEKFRANSMLGSTLFSNVTECIDSKLEGMNELLREVAQVGFAPITKNSDPRAQVGSQYNVLGVVDPYALVIGVPEPTYKAEGVEAGVVPASQSMRLIIAQKLSKSE
jgi:hypothetical protein